MGTPNEERRILVNKLRVSVSSARDTRSLQGQNQATRYTGGS